MVEQPGGSLQGQDTSRAHPCLPDTGCMRRAQRWCPSWRAVSAGQKFRRSGWHARPCELSTAPACSTTSGGAAQALKAGTDMDCPSYAALQVRLGAPVFMGVACGCLQVSSSQDCAWQRPPARCGGYSSRVRFYRETAAASLLSAALAAARGWGPGKPAVSSTDLRPGLQQRRVRVVSRPPW